MKKLFRLMVALCFLSTLACAGIIESMAPPPVIQVPGGAEPTGFNTAINNGVSTVEMTYSIDSSPKAVREYYEKTLALEGWDVQGVGTDAGGTVTASREGETFTVTVTEGTFTTVHVTQ